MSNEWFYLIESFFFYLINKPVYGSNGTEKVKQNSSFSQADFILICVSESYINETERGQSEVTESTTDKQLHTDYIYQLMVLEYNQFTRNRRFIPVMLDGTTEEHIPSWLQSTLVYKWPVHFRDLLWFLTKPETRIKSKTLTEQKSSEEEEEMVPDSPPAAAAT